MEALRTMEAHSDRWYLIRTKQYKENLARIRLSGFVSETLLPLLRTERPQWGRVSSAVVPLFPCYLFGSFDLKSAYHKIIRTPGVVGVVRTGEEPAEVDDSIIEEIRCRGRNGIVELPDEAFRVGQTVQVKNGPLRGLSAIFERYLSGTARVAILLDAVSGANLRVILPPNQIAPGER